MNVYDRTGRPASFWVALGLSVIAPLVTGCGKKSAVVSPPVGTAIEVVLVGRGDVSSSMDVTGTVKALDDVTLSAKLGGKVTSVPYREGAIVGRSAVVVQQQTVDQVNQVSASRAAAAAAKVRLTQARTNSTWQDIQSEAALKQAEQGLKTAEARLAITRQGARQQERQQVQSAVDSAQASFDNAKTTLGRTKVLVAQGALATANQDADQRAYDVAAAQLHSAKEQLSLIRAGARPEELQQAELAVRTAREQVIRARGDLKQRSLREDDIRAAEAGVQQAQASLAMASQGLADSSIRSPIAGVVAARMVEPGEMVSPGAPLIRVFNPSTLYYEASISEAQLPKVRNGQTVSLRCDAVPGKTFSGKVVKLYPSANINNRSFLARIAITGASELRPGMFAKGKIITEHRANAMTLPRDAVLNTEGGKIVFVVKQGMVDVPNTRAKPGKGGNLPVKKVAGMIAEKRSITTGLDSGTVVEITEGLSEGDVVVRTGQSYLQDGQAVRVLDSSPASSGAGAK